MFLNNIFPQKMHLIGQFSYNTEKNGESLIKFVISSKKDKMEWYLVVHINIKFKDPCFKLHHHHHHRDYPQRRCHLPIWFSKIRRSCFHLLFSRSFFIIKITTLVKIPSRHQKTPRRSMKTPKFSNVCMIRNFKSIQRSDHHKCTILIIGGGVFMCILIKCDEIGYKHQDWSILEFLPLSI